MEILKNYSFLAAIYLLARADGCFEVYVWFDDWTFLFTCFVFLNGYKIWAPYNPSSPQDDLTYLWAHKLFYLSATWKCCEKCTEKRTGMKSLLFLVRRIAQPSQGEIKKWVLFSEIWPQSLPAHFKTSSISTSILKTQIITGTTVTN